MGNRARRKHYQAAKASLMKLMSRGYDTHAIVDAYRTMYLYRHRPVLSERMILNSMRMLAKTREAERANEKV